MTQQPLVGQGHHIIETARSHSSHTTLGRTPLDEWSARRRDLYQTTHNNQERQNIQSTCEIFFYFYFPSLYRHTIHIIHSSVPFTCTSCWFNTYTPLCNLPHMCWDLVFHLVLPLTPHILYCCGRHPPRGLLTFSLFLRFIPIGPSIMLSNPLTFQSVFLVVSFPFCSHQKGKIVLHCQVPPFLHAIWYEMCEHPQYRSVPCWHSNPQSQQASGHSPTP
jgi:hypothetical protein